MIAKSGRVMVLAMGSSGWSVLSIFNADAKISKHIFFASALLIVFGAPSKVMRVLVSISWCALISRPTYMAFRSALHRAIMSGSTSEPMMTDSRITFPRGDLGA